MYYIYQTKNLVNNKIYIGVHQSIDIENDKYLGSGKHLERAIKKYGINNFTRRILHQFSSKDQAYNKELELVNEQFVNREDTYNMKVGGIGGFSDKLYWLGKHHSEETKEKCRLINIGRVVSEQTKEKLRKPKSEQTKEKMKDSRTYKQHSEQTKQKISKSLREYYSK